MKEEMEYSPDCWVIVKLDQGNEWVYKVLAGWGGGYTYGDSWKLSSGVERIEEDGDVYHFYNFSGSKYICRKSAERMMLVTSMQYQGWAKRVEEHPELGVVISIVPAVDVVRELGSNEIVRGDNH